MTEDPLHRLYRKHTNAFTQQQYRVWKDKQPAPVKSPSALAHSNMTSPLPAVANRPTHVGGSSPPVRRVPSTPPRKTPAPRKPQAATTPPRTIKGAPASTTKKKAGTRSSAKAAAANAAVRKRMAAAAATKATGKKEKGAPPKLHKIKCPEDPMELFDRLDGNASGKLSLAELDKGIADLYPGLDNKPAIMRAYKQTDASGDGFVCRNEFPAFLQFIVYYNNLWSVFSAVDADGDRRISREEFAAVAPQFAKMLAPSNKIREEVANDPDVIFDRMDVDGKGMVLFAELCQFLAEQKWSDKDMEDLHDLLQDDSVDNGIGSADAGGRSTTANNTKAETTSQAKPEAVRKIDVPDKEKALKLFDRTDENASGKLSLAELDKAIKILYPNLDKKAAVIRAYKSSDSSGDGFVARDEFMDFLQYIVYYNNLWNIFDTIDTDSDGRLQKKEIEDSFDLFRGDCVHELFEQMDENGGGMILFAEFCQYLARHPDAIDKAKLDAVSAKTDTQTFEL